MGPTADRNGIHGTLTVMDTAKGTCTYNDRTYQHGDVVCRKGRASVCVMGEWKDKPGEWYSDRKDGEVIRNELSAD